MARRPRSFVVDTDIFIDYLNGFERMREILDSPLHRVYFAAVTRKELLAKPRLSSTERRRVELLLLKHRLIPVDENIAENFSSLLHKYSRQGLKVEHRDCTSRRPAQTLRISHCGFRIWLLAPCRLYLTCVGIHCTLMSDIQKGKKLWVLLKRA